MDTMNPNRKAGPMIAETGTPYTKALLTAAFELVEDKANWKNPIDAKVFVYTDAEWLAPIMREAVVFFTGSVPTTEMDGDYMTVKADGYFAAVGA